MNLDSPPMLEHLFLESPWPVMAFCAVVCVVMLFLWQQRCKKVLGLLALVPVLIAVGVWSLAGSVTTDREQLIRGTRDLVAATAPLDPAALDRLVDPAATVSGPDGSVWLASGQLRQRLNAVLGRFKLESQRTRNIQAVTHDSGWGESSVIVRTAYAGGSPVNTGWLLTWQHSPGGGDAWRVVDIRWLRFQGFEVQQGMMP